jgi:hypothetical protein
MELEDSLLCNTLNALISVFKISLWLKVPERDLIITQFSSEPRYCASHNSAVTEFPFQITFKLQRWDSNWQLQVSHTYTQTKIGYYLWMCMSFMHDSPKSPVIMPDARMFYFTSAAFRSTSKGKMVMKKKKGRKGQRLKI